MGHAEGAAATRARAHDGARVGASPIALVTPGLAVQGLGEAPRDVFPQRHHPLVVAHRGRGQVAHQARYKCVRVVQVVFVRGFNRGKTLINHRRAVRRDGDLPNARAPALGSGAQAAPEVHGNVHKRVVGAAGRPHHFHHHLLRAERELVGAHGVQGGGRWQGTGKGMSTVTRRTHARAKVEGRSAAGRRHNPPPLWHTHLHLAPQHRPHRHCEAVGLQLCGAAAG
jgi:hypothetical protein